MMMVIAGRQKIVPAEPVLCCRRASDMNGLKCKPDKEWNLDRKGMGIRMAGHAATGAGPSQAVQAPLN